jgi:hypothetical protein
MPHTSTVITTSQGPSGKNQVSANHDLDTNQAARHLNVQQEIKAEGLDKEDNSHLSFTTPSKK